VNIYKISLSLMAYTATAGTLFLSASAASAAVTGHHHDGVRAAKTAPVPAAAPHIPFGLPTGYTVVTSAFAAAPGVQTAGEVRCPGTEQASGGGAVIASSDVNANLNSSYPTSDGQWWIVDVNNASSSSTAVTVYAICMAHSSSYQVVSSGPYPAFANWVSSQATQCPAGTGVTGGGAVSNSFATDVNINSTLPNVLAKGHTAWRVAMASSDPNDSYFTVYAVCRPKPTGYSIQTAPGSQVAPNDENSSTVTCPGASVPIGGGGFSSFLTSDTRLAMNSSYPNGNTWVIFENNGGNLIRSFYATAVCAGS
jgi:hypothetical protein